jgi:predicted DsbA family dithiol-disulfide isomerase
MSGRPVPLRIDVVSDVVCPWCYIGKRRLERALESVKDIPVEVHFRPFFLNPWVPREGMAREAYLETKFGSVEKYHAMAPRVVEAAASEGLQYNSKAISRQPNTIDSHRLIRWAEAQGAAPAMKQKLMDLYFRDGADLTRHDVLADAAASVGLDRETVLAKLASGDDVEAVTAEAEGASQAGIQGVPTFILDGKYALSGAYPSEQLAEAIRKVATGNVS